MIEEIKRQLAYSPSTGKFTWRVSKRGRTARAGDEAGSIGAYGYRVIMVDGRRYRGGRLAWLLVHGEWPAEQIDHINGCRTDDRIENLRCVTATLNNQNKRRVRSDSRTGVQGVKLLRNGRYAARIEIDGRRIELGKFKSAEQAGQAYLSAKRRLHPGYAPTGATA